MSESFFIGRNKFFIIILCLLGGAAMAQWQHAVDMSLGVRARSLSKPLPAASARRGIFQAFTGCDQHTSMYTICCFFINKIHLRGSNFCHFQK
jgi:hypothetical protein